MSRPKKSDNAKQWGAWVTDQDLAGTLPDFTAGQALLAATQVVQLPASIERPGISAPDSNGLFQLTGLPGWAGHLHQCAEVTKALPASDAKGRALANLSHANAVRGIEPAYECIKTANGAGELEWMVGNPLMPITNSTSWPTRASPDGKCNLGTVAGLIAHATKLGSPDGMAI